MNFNLSCVRCSKTFEYKEPVEYCSSECCYASMDGSGSFPNQRLSCDLDKFNQEENNMNYEQAVYPEELRPSLEDLKAQARHKEFQIRTLIRAAQIVHNISPDMMQAALLVAEKERAVNEAKNELAAVKNNLAAMLR